MTWTITDDDAANWAFGRIAHAEQQLAAVANARADQMQRVSAHFDREARPHQRRIEFLTGKLHEYAMSKLHDQIGPDDAPTDESVWKKLKKRMTVVNGHVQARRLDPKVELDSGAEARREYDAAWLARSLDADHAAVLALLRKLGAKVEINAPAPAVEDVAEVAGRVVWRDTGEVVPRARLRHAVVKLDAPKAECGAEHPVWEPAPEESGIPADWDAGVDDDPAD